MRDSFSRPAMALVSSPTPRSASTTRATRSASSAPCQAGGDHRTFQSPLGNAEDAGGVDQYDLRSRGPLARIGKVGHRNADHAHAAWSAPWATRCSPWSRPGRSPASICRRSARRRQRRSRLSLQLCSWPVQPFQQCHGRKPLGLALATAPAARGIVPLDDRIDHEDRRMRRSLALDLEIDRQVADGAPAPIPAGPSWGPEAPPPGCSADRPTARPRWPPPLPARHPGRWRPATLPAHRP